MSGANSVGRVPASQAGCRGFEPRVPLHSYPDTIGIESVQNVALQDIGDEVQRQAHTLPEHKINTSLHSECGACVQRHMPEEEVKAWNSLPLSLRCALLNWGELPAHIQTAIETLLEGES